MNQEDRTFLKSLFDAAVAAADPLRCLKPFLPRKPKGRTIVVGAGKGAAQLAAAFEQLWGEPLSGVVVTRYGYATPCKHIKVLEAAHPVPDQAGLRASQELFRAVENLNADDLVVALICGGGSALLPSPADGLTLQDEIALNETLLASGAPIGVMNAIRKQVSKIKGGKLAAAAYPARVVTLVVSDIPGDDPAQVASGPTVPDVVALEPALALAERWRIRLPESVVAYLKAAPATKQLDHHVFDKNEVHVVASAATSLKAAAELAERVGITAHILSDSVEGEAKDIGLFLAAITREVANSDRPFKKPALILSGGETTVTLKGTGKGGRNTELLLSMAIAAQGTRFAALAADTDGIDGSEHNAGAFADGTSVERLRSLGHDARAFLSNNDAWTAFNALGDLFVTGPTGTNVNDFRAILVR